MGMQEFIIQTVTTNLDGQKIGLAYQLQNQEGFPHPAISEVLGGIRKAGKNNLIWL